MPKHNQQNKINTTATLKCFIFLYTAQADNDHIFSSFAYSTLAKIASRRGVKAAVNWIMAPARDV